MRRERLGFRGSAAAFAESLWLSESISYFLGKAAPYRSRGIASQVSKHLTGKPEAFRKVQRQSRESHRQFLAHTARLRVSVSPCLRVPVSPCPRVPASPRSPLPYFPHLYFSAATQPAIWRCSSFVSLPAKDFIGGLSPYAFGSFRIAMMSSTVRRCLDEMPRSGGNFSGPCRVPSPRAP